MAYCPNPGCSHRRSTGRPAEYRDGFKHCADCDTPLLEGAPPSPARAAALPWPGPLRWRLLHTAAAFVGVFLLLLAPHPLLPHVLIRDLAGQGLLPGWMDGAVTSLLAAFVVVELVALAVPGLRQRRRTDPALRRKLWRWAAAGGLLLAAVRGFGYAVQLEYMLVSSSFGPNEDFSGGFLFRLASVVLTVVGTAALVAAVRWIDKRGVGRGMALLLLASLAAGAPHAVVMAWRAIAESIVAPGLVVALAVVFVGQILAMRAFFRAQARRDPAWPVRLPTCGLLPLDLALSGLALPIAFDNLFLHGRYGQALAAFVPGNPRFLALALVAALVFLVPASTLFYWRRRAWLAAPQQRRAWKKDLLRSLLFIGILLGMDHLLYGGLISLFYPSSLTLLLAFALLGDLADEVRAWRQAAGAALEPVAIHQDLADALDDVAAREGATLTGWRFRSLTYFFGPYVPLVVWAPRSVGQAPAP